MRGIAFIADCRIIYIFNHKIRFDKKSSFLSNENFETRLVLGRGLAFVVIIVLLEDHEMLNGCQYALIHILGMNESMDHHDKE